MPHEQPNRYDELARIVDIVAKARYKASKRLTLHSSFAQFTLTFLSIGLIIIPLLDLGGFSVRYEPKYIQIMQIIFAVMILAYSLLLSTGRFETRAEKMLACGIVLSRLMREIKPHKGTSSFRELLPVLAKARKFHDWLSNQPPDVDLIKAYYKEVTASTWIDKLPTKAARWSLFTGAGMAVDALGGGGIGTAAGIALSAVDTFLLNKIIRDWKPHHFVQGPLKQFVGNTKGT
jgi:hypothetical protein